MAITQIDRNFIITIDNLIGKNTPLTEDESPILDDGKFTRISIDNLSTLQYLKTSVNLWSKKKFGHLSMARIAEQVCNFIEGKNFAAQWSKLTENEQFDKSHNLFYAITRLKEKINTKYNNMVTKRNEIEKIHLITRIFYKKPSQKIISKYEEINNKLETALQTIENLKNPPKTRKTEETIIPVRKLYSNGVHLPRLLKADSSFNKYPDAVKFLSSKDSSTTPFIAMVRQIEKDYTDNGKQLRGKFNTMGLRVILMDRLIGNKNEIDSGPLDQNEIIKFNKNCILYLKNTYSKEFVNGMMKERQWAPYTAGNRVITGEIFQSLALSCVIDKNRQEKPIKNNFSSTEEVEIPDIPKVPQNKQVKSSLLYPDISNLTKRLEYSLNQIAGASKEFQNYILSFHG
jgi:hypothetical protein